MIRRGPDATRRECMTAPLPTSTWETFSPDIFLFYSLGFPFPWDFHFSKIFLPNNLTVKI